MKYGLFKKQYRRKTDHYKLFRRIIVSCFARPYGIAPTQKYKKVKYHHESSINQCGITVWPDLQSGIEIRNKKIEHFLIRIVQSLEIYFDNSPEFYVSHFFL